LWSLGIEELSESQIHKRITHPQPTTACAQVPFRTGERIAFSYLISQKYVGDDAELEVLRDGAVLGLNVK
jgi:hypothetical protein